eukprot:1157957-Pelagomonas_calceolata.AAC.4
MLQTTEGVSQDMQQAGRWPIKLREKLQGASLQTYFPSSKKYISWPSSPWNTITSPCMPNTRGHTILSTVSGWCSSTVRRGGSKPAFSRPFTINPITNYCQCWAADSAWQSSSPINAVFLPLPFPPPRLAAQLQRTHRAGVHGMQVGHDGCDEAGALTLEEGNLFQ